MKELAVHAETTETGLDIYSSANIIAEPDLCEVLTSSLVLCSRFALLRIINEPFR